MSRSVFGWDLPPGCSQRDIDDAFGNKEVCCYCGKELNEDAEDDVCPRCQDKDNSDD